MINDQMRLERLFVWAGGLTFVLSLAFLAWWYIVWLGRMRPLAGWEPVAFNTLLFSAFALHHSALAQPSAKALLARVFAERLLRSTYVWTASILLVLVGLFWRPIGGQLFATRGPAALVHVAAQVAGLALIALSVRAIDPLELAGIRPGGASQDLQIRGPYRLVRHPLYLGWILAVFGAARMTGDRFAFAVISSLYLIVAVQWEERSLEREFGAAYRDYKRLVRWKIVPFVF
jgi:protein-S-isoprenylcysteine O-methyltransferase Ste14